jgi:hypothetical protein
MAKKIKKPRPAPDPPMFEQKARAGALNDKIAGLKALRLARDSALPAATVKLTPGNGSLDPKAVTLSPEDLRRYETMSQDRETREYVGHLPPDRA